MSKGRVVNGIGIGLLIYCLGSAVQPVYAHSGEPPAPHDFRQQWFWQQWLWQQLLGEPWLVLGLVGVALFYGCGVATVWQRAGRGRLVGASQVAAFGLGMVLIAVALLSPLAALSEALFSAHMVQHLLLMNGAAPLIIWGLEPAIFLWALPLGTRRGVGRWWHQQSRLQQCWRWLNRPLVVWSIYTVTLWLWHAPRFYQAALTSEALHRVEHGGFFVSALLFWWVLHGSHRRTMQLGVALLFLFTTALHSGLLAAIITFAQRPLYPIYAPYVLPWGLTPLSDQQLAGVIMWIPVGFAYLGALLWRLWQQLANAEEAKGDRTTAVQLSTRRIAQSTINRRS